MTALVPRVRLGGRLAFSERSLGLGIVVTLAIAFAVVPLLSPYEVTDLVAAPMLPPSADHPFGTDLVGRDIFVRVFAAGRSNLLITVVGVAICLVAGTVAGVAIGCAGPRVRAMALRIVDALLGIPALLLILALVAVMGETQVVPFLPATISTVIVAIAVVGWAPYARLAAAQTLVIRQRESVVAARLLGYGRVRVLVRHIALAVVGVNLSFAATHAILTTGLTASLAFLGTGVQEPTPELGAMMQAGVALMSTAWWITIIPGVAVLVLGVGFALMADTLKD